MVSNWEAKDLYGLRWKSSSVVTPFTTDTGRDWQDGYGDFGWGRNAGVGGIQEGGDAEGLARETRVHFQH